MHHFPVPCFVERSPGSVSLNLPTNVVARIYKGQLEETSILSFIVTLFLGTFIS